MSTIRTIQPFAFLAADNFKNARVSCDNDQIDDFDLFPWIENLESTTRNRLDFFRFLTRSKRSTKPKKKQKTVHRAHIEKVNKSSLEKSPYFPTLSNIYQIKPLNSVVLNGNNQINISILSSSTPTPQKIEINIKIQNEGSTTERFSTVTRRKPSTRPSYEIDYELYGEDYHKPILLKPHNSYRPLDSLQKPLENSYSKPNSYDDDIVTPLRPSGVINAKPVNTYGGVSNIAPVRPYEGGYTKPNDAYGHIGAVVTSFEPSGGGYAKPNKRPSSSSYSIEQEQIYNGEIVIPGSYHQNAHNSYGTVLKNC